MNKKWILIISFIVIMFVLGFYFYNKEKSAIIDNSVTSGNFPLGKCYQRSNEAAFNQPEIPWGMGISYSKATTGTYNQATDNLYTNYVLSFLKGIDVQPSQRTIAIHAQDIRDFKNSSLGNVRHWEIVTGEFLCN